MQYAHLDIQTNTVSAKREEKQVLKTNFWRVSTVIVGLLTILLCIVVIAAPPGADDQNKTKINTTE
jgi:hypothetical protein